MLAKLTKTRTRTLVEDTLDPTLLMKYITFKKTAAL